MTTDFDVSNFSLGVVEAPPDPRTLRLEDFLIPSELPSRPEVYSNSRVISDWGMLGNDGAGDCVVAGHAHFDMLTSQKAGTPNRPTTQEVLDLYFHLTGGADVGLVIRKFLSYLRSNTFEGRRILGFASVDPRDTELTRIANYLFEAVYRGTLLPKSAQAQTGANNLWRKPSNTLDPASKPGSWGGHLTLDTGYNPDNLETITWGFVQPVALDFYPYCSMESYAVIPLYPVPGFNQRKFIDALRAISTDVDADPAPAPDPTPPQPDPAPGRPPFWTGFRLELDRSDGGTDYAAGTVNRPPGV